MLHIGSLFAGRYRIDQEIGRGSFGVVYRAFDIERNYDVAVKVLHPEADADPTLRHRLRREAKLTAEMKSPHCVRILDVAETMEKRTYTVMELLRGEELTLKLAREKRLDPALAVEIARQTLEAVGEAHRLGVIHRDLKPHNIFLCRGTVPGAVDVKVLDFGIAKVAGRADGGGLSESARLTTHGNVLGTPTYMSPEQCRGELAAPTSDVYSMGIVVYEMLAGRVPFDDPNPVLLLVKHNQDPVPPLPNDVARLPIAAAVMRSLEKDPTKRYASAEEFATALVNPTAAVATNPATAAKTAAQSAAAFDTEAASGTTTIAVRFSEIMKGLTGQFNAVNLDGTPRKNRTPLVLGTIIAAAALAAGVWFALK